MGKVTPSISPCGGICPADWDSEMSSRIQFLCFDYVLDQLQLVPSGGDSGPHRTSTDRIFFCHDIRVQLREIKCMELVT
jgi:hypothetical protein